MQSLTNFDTLRLTNAGLIGIDEAGRGPLAGPVTAAAVYISPDFYQNLPKDTHLINDSKQLTPETRQHLFKSIFSWEAQSLLSTASAEATVPEIESLNILQATTLAMNRALDLLIQKLPQNLKPSKIHDLPLFSQNNPTTPKILVDGRPLKNFPYPHQAITQGDAKSLAIAIASIIAKVSRDHIMHILAKRYPGYALEKNKGYGTQSHRDALKKLGPSKIHRPSFLTKILAIPTPTAPKEKVLI